MVIDPQRVFADPESPWGASGFADVVPALHSLARAFAGRVLVTRWVAPSHPAGSWAPYLDAWPFARVPADDPLFDVVEGFEAQAAHVLTATTFGKYRLIEQVTGSDPHLILTGVATDCCVISTALAAADAGAFVEVVSDACAGSSPANHEAALQVMGLYAPQLTLTTVSEVVAR